MDNPSNGHKVSDLATNGTQHDGPAERKLIFKTSPENFTGYLSDVRFSSIENGVFHFVMTTSEKMSNGYNTLHGAATMALIDNLASFAIAEILPGVRVAWGMDISATYMLPVANHDEITIMVRPFCRSFFGYVDVEITRKSDGRLAAKGKKSISILPELNSHPGPFMPIATALPKTRRIPTRVSDPEDLKTAQDFFTRLLSSPTYNRTLKTAVPVVVSKPGCVFEMVVADSVADDKKNLHTSAIASMLDVFTAINVILWVPGKNVLSVDMSMSCVESIPVGGTVEITTNVLRVGRTLGFVEAEFRDKSNGHIIAQGRQTLALVAKPAPPPDTPK
ncbi:unnamed protein product, partial [Mesorhabditis spiculigera]